MKVAVSLLLIKIKRLEHKLKSAYSGNFICLIKLFLSFDGIPALAGEDNRGCHGSFDFWELFYWDLNDILLGFSSKLATHASY